MHLHAVLRIEVIGSQESCGLQAQGWCGTHPGRVCICRAGKILDSDDNGGGKVNWEVRRLLELLRQRAWPMSSTLRE
jgi:hypothetical protein